jgi:hypothetical protein
MLPVLASPYRRRWTRPKDHLLVNLIGRVHALPKEGYLIGRHILIRNGTIDPMVVIALHDHGNRDSLGLLDLISEGGSPTEHLPILLLPVVTVGKAHICIRWLDDLHVALEARMIIPSEIVIFDIVMHLVGAWG